MERTIVLIRHAKSSWASPLQSDFDRPLNDRGNNDAPIMGARLKKMDIIPDLIISSPAKRARQTAKKIADAVGYEIDNIKWEEKLYHCIPSVFEVVISQISDKVKTVFIVSHNPGITDFVNSLSKAFTTDHMPTCGIAGARADTEDWSSFSLAKKKVFLYEYPGKDD